MQDFFETMHFESTNFDSTGIVTVTSRSKPEPRRWTIGRYSRESRDKHILCSMYKFGQRQTDIEGLEGFFDVYAKASTSPILNSRISTPLRPGSVLRTLKPKQVY